MTFLVSRLGCLSPPGPNEFFRLHPQRVGHASNVVEVADDLYRIVDGPVIQTVGAEDIEVRRGHLVLALCEFGSKLAQGTVNRRERGRAPVADKRLYTGVGLRRIRRQFADLITEVM